MDFTHWESKVAGRLGLSRDNMRRMRSELLTEGADFITQSNRICLTAAAVEKIAAALRVPAPPVELTEANPAPVAVVEKTIADAAIGTVRLCVWRQTKNPHIIEAFHPEKDPSHRSNIVRVIVKKAANFIRVGGDGKPMTLPARHVRADLYELLGACPRRKGRW